MYHKNLNEKVIKKQIRFCVYCGTIVGQLWNHCWAIVGQVKPGHVQEVFPCGHGHTRCERFPCDGVGIELKTAEITFGLFVFFLVYDFFKFRVGALRGRHLGGDLQGGAQASRCPSEVAFRLLLRSLGSDWHAEPCRYALVPKGIR